MIFLKYFPFTINEKRNLILSLLILYQWLEQSSTNFSSLSFFIPSIHVQFLHLFAWDLLIHPSASLINSILLIIFLILGKTLPFLHRYLVRRLFHLLLSFRLIQLRFLSFRAISDKLWEENEIANRSIELLSLIHQGRLHWYINHTKNLTSFLNYIKQSLIILNFINFEKEYLKLSTFNLNVLFSTKFKSNGLKLIFDLNRLHLTKWHEPHRESNEKSSTLWHFVFVWHEPLKHKNPWEMHDNSFCALF